MKAMKGKFVLGTRTYNWQVIINGVAGFGKTKREATKDAREASARKAADEATLDDFNYVGSRHHY
jgi:hypothetical protein